MVIVLMSLLYAAFVDVGIFVGAYTVYIKAHKKSDWWKKLYQPLPIVTLSVFGVTLVVTGLQFVFPSLYFVLQRDGVALAAGEWWRLFTPLLVQSGGITGAAFNLINLLVLGVVAEKVLRRRSWLLFYFGAGLIAEVMAYALTHSAGAGNSLAYFGLATGVMAAGLGSKESVIKYASMAGLALGAILVLINDIHGIVFVIAGIMASLIMLWPKHLHGRR